MLGEGYTLDDDEDMTVKTVTDLWLYQVPKERPNMSRRTLLRPLKEPYII